MASDTQTTTATRVQRTVRFDSEVDDRVQALAQAGDRSLEAQYRRLVVRGLEALAADDAAAS